ncbi:MULTISPECIES: hypothetical protein [unclassified Pseudomonas]|uniref:hypothetical protein n=1 Tax=unclassified Pseudomonas TaxID=196821 RepID=UPI0011ED9C2A|nr:MULTISPECIES: hypothetical protein [unclassified Pseudomonas]KAA0943431.1 hypothetical protein FQ182_25315 [Pseudomonas sp. ANT_H4]KAA0949920.1 hypothetical protein FQ186_22070 [Pseudomonas sp. ANT_H14]
MFSPNQRSSGPVIRKVVGLVVLLPLLLTLVKLPFFLAITMSLTAIASSFYGFWFAVRNAGRWLAAFAGAMALLNLISLIAMGTPSVLKGLYYIAWLYGYPIYSNWAYWNL